MNNNVDEIKQPREAIERLNEMPKYTNDELPLGQLSQISMTSLSKSYSLLGSVAGNMIQVYEKNTGTGFIAGFERSGNFNHFLDIGTRRIAYPVLPTGLSSDYHQVSSVLVSEGLEQRGYTKEVYNLVAKKYDLVSDWEQYGLAKQLWQSLARNSGVNVYVFSGGYYHRYDGQNISEKEIWGGMERASTLLVATTKNMKGIK
jgi:hypothetical protein